MELEGIVQGFCILKIFRYLNTELLAIYFDGIVRIRILNFQPKVPSVTLSFLANIFSLPATHVLRCDPHIKSRGPILRVTSSETLSMCVKHNLNTRCCLANALVT